MIHPTLILAAVLAQPGPDDRLPAMTTLPKDLAPFKYVEAKVPFYPPSGKQGANAKNTLPMQLPLDAAEARRHYVTPVDFSVQLFAADPDIKRPICMNWDERGRLWIAESVDYPNDIQLPGKGRDRLVICADTKGTGRADKFTVFADNLSIPTGFTFARGGVIVHNGPSTLFLKDTDGDDVADQRTTLFTGWSVGDTHAGPSNLHYGFDNWIWGIVGYSGFQGTIGGEKHSFRTGFYRFKPDGSKFEFLRNTNNNSWGVGFSEDGLVFGSTANGNPSVYLPIPNRYYEKVRGWSSTVLGGIAGDPKFYPITDKVRQVDYHGRFTAAAGHALYTARTYPKEYWNRAAFVNEPTGHLTATFMLNRQGADFTSRNAWNLLASDDEWASPIAAEVGPDGHVWVIDWYNYIVQHNPTPAGFKNGKGNAYETPLRDKTHGRIYRVVYDKAAALEPFTLKDATPEKLVATLRHGNMFWRKHAQRLLVERGQKDVVPALLDLVNIRAMDTIGLNPGAMHALWTLQGLGVLDGDDAKTKEALLEAVQNPAAGVRRTAAAVMPRTESGALTLLQHGLLADADAQVRLAALLALSEMPPSAKGAQHLVRFLAQPENLKDRWLRDGLTCAAAQNDLEFLKSLKDLKQAGPEMDGLLATVAQHYARGAPAASVGDLLAHLDKMPPRVAETIIAGLVKGWPKDRPAQLTAEHEKNLAALMTHLGPGARGQLAQLAARWGSNGLERFQTETVKGLLAAILDEKHAEADRIDAARQLVQLRPQDMKVVDTLLETIQPRVSPALAAGLIEAAGASQATESSAAILKHFRSWSPATRAAALRALLARPVATQALLTALEKNQLPAAELALDQKQALLNHPDAQLAARAKAVFAKAGGLPSPDRQKVVEEWAGVLKDAGDAKIGQAVFRKHCALCHIHSGEGAQIGPDLTGMAVHTKEHLLADILDPSRNVEGNFRVYTVTTANSQIFTGLLASETKTAVELIDSQAKKQVVLREDIEQLVSSPKSLMPEGFEKQLNKKEMADLLAFLTLRGKYLPLPLDRVATIVSTRGMFNDEQAGAERLIFSDWKPRTFEGVPFNIVDPREGRLPNVVLLYGPQGKVSATMPKSVQLPCNAPTNKIHLLSGVSGWGFPLGAKGSVTMIVRLHYADGKTEDHPLRNGEHFADYIRRVDVPGSKFAFALRDQQIRYLAITPARSDVIRQIEFLDGPDTSAAVVMAATLELP